MPSRVMKYIEPSAPVAIRPRNCEPASKVHIRTPALCADEADEVDGAVVLAACGAVLTLGVDVAVGVATGVGHRSVGHAPTSVLTATSTDWLSTPEKLVLMQVHPNASFATV
jgi:hypothetical protein